MCYCIPALVTGRMVLVVSPLIGEEACIGGLEHAGGQRSEEGHGGRAVGAVWVTTGQVWQAETLITRRNSPMPQRSSHAGPGGGLAGQGRACRVPREQPGGEGEARHPGEPGVSSGCVRPAIAPVCDPGAATDQVRAGFWAGFVFRVELGSWSLHVLGCVHCFLMPNLRLFLLVPPPPCAHSFKSTLISLFSRGLLALVAVDEAHCISR